jgi:alkaline phosphatase
MPSEVTPLLAGDRPSSSHSEERAAAEDEALHQPAGRRTAGRDGNGFWREIGLLIWALAATAAVIVLAVLIQHQSGKSPESGQHGDKSPKDKPSGKRNLIFMVSDGMGPASLSMARSFRQHVDGLEIDDTLALDQHIIGTSRTRSSNSLVTDSAAGATAFSCGKKSYNGAISMLPDYTPCGTVLEAAKKAGYMTGLVVTTDLTDATPACFASHVTIRLLGDSIASQEVGEHPLGRVVDLMLGGGRCHFLPNGTEGSCRQDNRDITKLAREEYGWKYVDDREGFDSLKLGEAVELPVLGLFANTDIPFEIDRRIENHIYPSLDEMTRTALKALELATKDSDKGFFLMIEGSRIDHSGHANDPAAQVHEVIAYDKAFASVLEFLKNSDTEGVVVSTSDHETGGLSVAKQISPLYPDYKWIPTALANASHSAERCGQELFRYLRTPHSIHELRDYIWKNLIEESLGIYDADEEDVLKIINHPEQSFVIFADMVSRRAQIGWSTHGHSAVDVNIYGSANAGALRGNHENTEIGKFLREYLDVDVEDVTKELNEKSKSALFASRIPTDGDFEQMAKLYGGRRVVDSL